MNDDDDDETEKEPDVSVNCLSKMVDRNQSWTKLGIMWIHLRLELLFSEQQAIEMVVFAPYLCEYYSLSSLFRELVSRVRSTKANLRSLKFHKML